MRSKFLIITALIAGSLSQVSAQKGLDIGIKGSFIGDRAFGTSMPNAMIAEEGPLSMYHSNGGQVGLELAYYFDEQMGLSTGMNTGIRWINSKLENAKSDRSGPYTSGQGMRFMEVPLTFVYRKAINDDGLAVSTRLGPTLSFWNGTEYGSGVFLEANEAGDTSDTFLSASTKVEAEDPVFGALLGVRLEKELGNGGRIAYGASYHGQLTKGLRWDTEYHTGSEKGRSSGSFSSSFLNFDIAYYFPMGLSEHG